MEVHRQMKRFFALLAALLFLLPALSSWAEDETEEFADDYDIEYEEEFPDDEGYTDDRPGEEEFPDDDSPTPEVKNENLPDNEEADNKRQTMTQKLNALSGFEVEDKRDDKERKMIYIPLEDGVSCTMMLYYGTEEDGCDVTVPEELGGLTVRAIGNSAFSGHGYVETIILPETIEMVGNMAFFKCYSLKNVEMHDGIIMLGKSCFGACNALEELRLPESLEVIDEFAFLQCNMLPELTFGKNLKAVGANAFMLCDSLKRITMPKTVVLDENALNGVREDAEIIYLDE